MMSAIYIEGTSALRSWPPSLRRRSSEGILPTRLAPPATRPSLLAALAGPPPKPDGSARSIRMPNPIAEGFRHASVETKRSWSALLTFALLVFAGRRRCAYYAESTEVACDQEVCRISVREVGSKISVRDLHRSQLVAAEQVRVDRHGEVVDASKAKTVERRRLGYSYALVYHPDPESGNATETLLMSRRNISRQRARSHQSRMRYYVEGGTQALDLREGRDITAGGVAAIVLGIFGLAVTLMVGKFVDPPSRPRRRNRAASGKGQRRNSGGGPSCGARY